MKLSAMATVGAAGVAGLLISGCANSGFDLSTASLSPPAPAVVAQKTDPVCASLASQISALRSDASIGRLEKAAAGKAAKVEVKRATLQKQTELNKAYADFQTRCGPPVAAQSAAVQAPVAPPPPVIQNKTAAAAPSDGAIAAAPISTDAN